MPFCELQSDNIMFEVTPVDNLFIMEYMLTAPGEFVRVYLLGLAMCHYPQKDNTLEGMAHALHMDVEEVRRAMAYWERQGLVVGVSGNPPEYRYIPARAASGGVSPDNKAYQYRDFFAAVNMKFDGQALDPRHWQDITDWLEVLKLPEEVILMMIESEFERSKSKKHRPDTVFKHLNETAQQWADDGIRTVEAAKYRIVRDGETGQLAQQVARAMGFRRSPTDPEIAMIGKWLHEWNYTRADIMKAMEKTTTASQPSFAYLDSILGKYCDKQGTFDERSSEDDKLRSAASGILRLMGVSGMPGDGEVNLYRQLIDEGYPETMIAEAASKCGSSNRIKSMESVRAQLAVWRESGIATMEDLEERKKDSEFLRGLFVRAGSEKKPRLADLQNLLKWRETLTDDVISLAADAAHGANDPASYMAKVIESWQAAGITTTEAAASDMKSHRAPSIGNGGTAARKPDFEQREYDDEFFDSFADDPMKYLKTEVNGNDAK